MHSSTVTVAVIESGNVNHDPCLQRSPDDYGIEWYSGSGAGGQHRNRHMCSARVRHNPTGIVKQAQTRSRENSLRSAIAAIDEELDQRLKNSIGAATNLVRQRQVGTGERSDKRRTIRFQDCLVLDHVTGKRMQADAYMKGYMDKLWL